MSRHVNIPIFIPHLGCPNQCVFCNQRTISGVHEFDGGGVKEEIDLALSTIEEDAEVEIAFFGGSFTGVDEELMISLLETAYEYIKCGRVSSIRCSTRPDYINEEVLARLKKYGVKTIELGLQSADDNVLQISKRGHDFAAEVKACELIVNAGFDLVGQMMIGLPASTPETEMMTARFIASSGARAARIYPTVVFRETELCGMAISGEYCPISLDDAISRSADVLEYFINEGIDVIRIGLSASENLSSVETYYAGPNHSALGELVENELYYKKIRKLLNGVELSKNSVINICVPQNSLSKAVGQKKRNKLRLLQELGCLDIRFTTSEKLAEYEVELEILD